VSGPRDYAGTVPILCVVLFSAETTAVTSCIYFATALVRRVYTFELGITQCLWQPTRYRGSKLLDDEVKVCDHH
jgi:hypothetical protein